MYTQAKVAMRKFGKGYKSKVPVSMARMKVVFYALMARAIQIEWID